MARTTPEAVEELLGTNWDGETDLAQFVAIASAITDKVAACVARRRKSISAADLALIELLMAADAYTDVDPLFKARSTDRASASFAGRDGEIGPFARRALQLDATGCLRAVLSGKVLKAAWLGKPKADQRTWGDRNAGRVGED